MFGRNNKPTLTVAIKAADSNDFSHAESALPPLSYARERLKNSPLHKLMNPQPGATILYKDGTRSFISKKEIENLPYGGLEATSITIDEIIKNEPPES